MESSQQRSVANMPQHRSKVVKPDLSQISSVSCDLGLHLFMCIQASYRGDQVGPTKLDAHTGHSAWLSAEHRYERFDLLQQPFRSLKAAFVCFLRLVSSLLHTLITSAASICSFEVWAALHAVVQPVLTFQALS